MIARIPFRPLGFAALVLVLARLPLLGWGLPGSTHRWSFHPDEAHIYQTVASIPRHGGRPRAPGDETSGWLPYGAGWYYAVAAAGGAGHLLGFSPIGDVAYYRAHPHALGRLHLTGRLLGLAACLLALPALARIARAAGGEDAVLPALLFFAFLPSHALAASVATPHAAATCLLLWSLAEAIRFAQTGGARAAVGAGAAAGAAGGLYLTGGFALVGLLAAAAVVRSRSGGAIRPALAGVAAGGAVFAVLQPWATLEPVSFVRDFAAVADRWVPRKAWFSRMHASNLFWGASPGILLAACGGAFRAAPIPRTILLSFVAVFWILFGRSITPFSRHFLPIFVVLPALAGAAVASTRRPGWWTAAVLLPSLAILSPFWIAAVGSDTRETARAWFETRVPAGATVGVPSWFFAPHLDVRRDRIDAAVFASGSDTPPEWIFVAEWERGEVEAKWPGRYEPVRRFAGAIRRWRALGGRTFPEDLRYISPEILLLRDRSRNPA